MAILESPASLSLAAVWILPKVSHEVDGVPISISEDKTKSQTCPRCFFFSFLKHNILLKRQQMMYFQTIHSLKCLKFDAFFKQYIEFANNN